MFADDKQLSDSVDVSEPGAVISHLSTCVSDTGDWRASRKLQLNASKTEIAWFGSRVNLNKKKISGYDLSLPVGSDVIKLK